jgi:hypothetical protein
MATVMGLRDVANFTSDERPKNWREMILYLYPRSEQKAPLNALLAGMKKQPTDDPEFNWFEKSSPTRYSAANYSTGYDSAATQITVDDATMFRADDLVRNDATDEVMRVTADCSGTTLTVARGWGSTADTVSDNDDLFIVGTAIAEGATARSSLYKDPSKVYNYTQIFRYPLKLTETAKATHLRTGAPIKDMKREALDQHTIDMERGMIWGVRNEDLTGSEPKRSTGGIISYISTNSTSVAGAGALTYTALMEFLRDLFKKGSGERLCFCGNQFLLVLNMMAEARGELNLQPGSNIYGLAIIKWITPFGVVYLKNHPLFNEITPHTKTGLFIETRNIIYRYLSGNGVNRDTKYLKNRQENDEDCTEDEFLTECGLEVQHEETHGLLDNVNSYSST